MYNKVLVTLALDHGLSQSLFDIAERLLAPDGQILALHVVEEAFGLARATQSGEHSSAIFESARGLLSEKLKDQHHVQGHIVEGHVYRSIVEFAAEQQVNCIVIGSHKPGLSDYLIGSTASNVVRHAPCAVHVHR